MCVVDDAQWLDRASAQALAFVARRLLAESVVMVFAAREPSEVFTGLPRLMVDGLRDADARELLASVIPGALDERVADQLVAETRGNPLALLELPRELSASQLAGGFGLPGAVSVAGPDRGELPESLPGAAGRHAAAPAGGGRGADRRSGAAVACRGAALHHGAGDGSRRASAGLLGIDAQGALPPPARALGHLPSRVSRGAARGASGLGRRDRRRVDPDRRAWHLAEASAATDEDVAAELERAAGRAEARGGWPPPPPFSSAPTALTPDPSRRAQRALAAAQTKYEAGSLDDARGLLATAEAGAARRHPSRPGASPARPDRVRLAARQRRAAAPAEGRAPARGARREARACHLPRGALRGEVRRPARGRRTRGRGERGARLRLPAGRAAAPSGSPAPGFATLFTEGYAGGSADPQGGARRVPREAVLPPHEARWLRLACRARSGCVGRRDLAAARHLGARAAPPRRGA